jgi:hypothetical protein
MGQRRQLRGLIDILVLGTGSDHYEGHERTGDDQP